MNIEEYLKGKTNLHQLLKSAKRVEKEFCPDCVVRGINNAWDNCDGTYGCESEACELYILKESIRKFEAEPAV